MLIDVGWDKSICLNFTRAAGVKLIHHGMTGSSLLIDDPWDDWKPVEQTALDFLLVPCLAFGDHDILGWIFQNCKYCEAGVYVKVHGQRQFGNILNLFMYSIQNVLIVTFPQLGFWSLYLTNTWETNKQPNDKQHKENWTDVCIKGCWIFM